MKKKLIPSITLLICSFWLTSCNSPQNNAAKEAQPNSSPATATSNTEQAKTEPTPPSATNTPAIPGNTPGNTNLPLPTPGSIPVIPGSPSLPQSITANTPLNLDPSLTSAINTPAGTEATTNKTTSKTPRKTAIGSTITTEDPTKTAIGSTITTADPTKTAIGSPITTADLTKSPTSTVKLNPAEPETRASRIPRTTTRTPTRTNTTRVAARNDAVRKTTSGAQPKVATIKRMVSGDLMCYVTLVDERGREQEVGATFDICNQQTAFLNRKVRLSYQTLSVNDCQSAEPCGKTRKESLISKIELDDDKLATRLNTDTQTISNGRWRITISNLNSWTGVNGTGNLSYRGCDARGRCIDLTGGTVACRDGICSTGWTNGDFSYILQQRMSEGGATSPTTLIVRKGDDVVQTATGFRVVRSGN
jgi:hypothetical protein